MMQNNIKVAITGGIGSGKSTVAKFIAEQGFTVLSCDEIYRELLQDKNFLHALTQEFGNILTPDNNLDREKLSSIVFSDKAKLQKLNNITHPIIMSEAIKRMTGEGIYFCEVPLLFEGGFERLFDEVIVVLRNENKRISYVAERDNISAENVQKRINSQLVYSKADLTKYYVIHNDLNLSNLREKTLEIVKRIVKE